MSSIVTRTKTDAIPAVETTYAVLWSISFCHLLNDMVQALLPAIYPTLKAQFHLSFAQVGFVTLAFQFTASLLQPAVGVIADKRPMPYSLATGMVFSLFGLLLLSTAPNYPTILLAASVIGMGSAVFHPESSRVARMASGGRHGLAQSLFQVGGNIGSALGPLTAAVIVQKYGQTSIAWYSGVALIAILVLWNVGVWYKNHGLRRMVSAQHGARASNLPRKRLILAFVVLVLLIFTKYLYLVSLTSYYTFYLIQRFQLSVEAAQVYLFVFLSAVAIGTIIGGPLGDRLGRRNVIWFSILGVLPFTLVMPYVNLFWTAVLSFVIGCIIASAFPAIVVYGQELLPGRVGMVSGAFFGFAFGMGGLGAAMLGKFADLTSIEFVYRVCAALPVLGIMAVFLPKDRTLHSTVQ